MTKSKSDIPVRLIHLADASYAANKRSELQTALDEVQLREPQFDALIVTGDIAARPDEASYQGFADTIGAEGRILGSGLTHVTLGHIRKITQILDSNPESPVLLFSRYYSVSETQADQVSMESLRELKIVLEMLSLSPQVKALVCCHAYRSTFEDDNIGGLSLLATPSVSTASKSEAGYRTLDLYPDGEIASDVIHLSTPQRKSAAA